MKRSGEGGGEKIKAREDFGELDEKPRDRFTRRFWLIYSISRVIILFIPLGFAHNFGEFIQYGNSILYFTDPYDNFTLEAQGYLVVKYPPLYLLQAAFLMFFFGTTQIGLRLGFLIFDLAVTTILYKFAFEFQLGKTSNPSRSAALSVMAYAFSPLVLLFTLGLPQKFMAQFFMLLGLYAFYKKKSWVVGLALCLGFLTELYPIFCLMPIGLFYIARSNWKALLHVFLAFVVVFLVVGVPFLLIDWRAFIFSFTTHFNRTPQVTTLWDNIPAQQAWGLDIFGILQLSPLGIIFLVSFFVLSTLTFLFFKKFKNEGEESVLIIIVVFFLTIPVIFLTLNARNLFWVFPLITVLISKEVKDRAALLVGVLQTIQLGLVLMLYVSVFPEQVFADLNSVEIGTLSQWSENNFHLYTVLVLISAIPWFINYKGFFFGARSSDRTISVVNYLNVVIIFSFVQLYSQGRFAESVLSNLLIFLGGAFLFSYMVYFLVFHCLLQPRDTLFGVVL
ncbi:MAG: hypothetical protein ACTSU5_09415 [Promethearchaeota archaeon]